MTPAVRFGFGLLLIAGLARPQAGVQVPVVSTDPAVQRFVEAQLAGAASVRLDPNARVTSLSLTARPLREILDAVAKTGGVTLRFASGMTSLDASSTVTLLDKTVEDALRIVLEGQALTFQAMGPKTAFIYPDTPANRDKYTASIRAFPIAKAELTPLTQQLNQILKPTADGFRAMVLTVSDSRTIVVRAVPELMVSIATWIAEHDKDAQATSRGASLSETERTDVLTLAARLNLGQPAVVSNEIIHQPLGCEALRIDSVL